MIFSIVIKNIPQPYAPLETTRRNWKDARFKIVSLEKKNATTISDFNFPPVVAAACLTSNYA